MEVSGQPSGLATLPLGKVSSTQWKGEWAGPGASSSKSLNSFLFLLSYTFVARPLIYVSSPPTDQSVLWLGCELEDRGSITGRERDFLLFATASTPALGPTQPPIQRVPVGLFPRVKGRAVKLTTHLHLLPRLMTNGVIPSLPHTSSWRGT
jgi:hypothetical protein